MRLCAGAPKEFLDKVGAPCSVRRILRGPMIRGPPPPPTRDHVPAYRIWEVLCKSHTAYMTRYTAGAG